MFFTSSQVRLHFVFSIRDQFFRKLTETIFQVLQTIHRSSMQNTDAFIPSTLSPIAFSSLSRSQRPLSRERKPPNGPAYVSRRRLRACESTAPADSSEPDPQSKEKEESARDLDDEASDLALPILKELFAGAGKPGCEQCDGKGTIPCSVCDGKGYIALTMMDTTSSAQCRLCRGGRSIPCPTCRQIVYKSVVWWDEIPSQEEDPEEKWREGPDGNPRISWTEPPTGS